MGEPTDYLGRETGTGGQDGPQTVNEFAEQRDDLTDEQREQLQDQEQPGEQQDGEQQSP